MRVGVVQDEELVFPLLGRREERPYRLRGVALPADERHVVAAVHPTGLKDADPAVLLDVQDLVEDVIGEVVLGYRARAEPDFLASVRLVEDAARLVLDQR